VAGAQGCSSSSTVSATAPHQGTQVDPTMIRVAQQFWESTVALVIVVLINAVVVITRIAAIMSRAKHACSVMFAMPAWHMLYRQLCHCR
jgi:hypothetical protein